MKKIIYILAVMVLTMNMSVPTWAASINSHSVSRSSKTVTIQGTISSGAGKQVTVKVVNPSGDVDHLDQITSEANGSFNVQYQLSNPIRGDYEVSVNGEDVNELATDTFNYSTSSSGGGSHNSGGGSHNNSGSSNNDDEETTVDDEETTVDEESDQFDDVDESTASWAGEAIGTLARYGIIRGQSENKFAPGSNATRAEFAVMISRLLELKGNNTGSRFSDVPQGQWYSNAIDAVATAGYINGRGDSVFAPGDTITREEIATILGRILVQKLGITDTEATVSELSYFNDVDQISPWAQVGVAVLYENEVISGRPGGVFDPKANATRAEVAVMLFRMTKLVDTVVK